MSREPPIYPQTHFSFPEHFYLPSQLRPPPSNFFAQPPNGHTGVQNNFNPVQPGATAAISPAQPLRLPNEQQPPIPLSTMELAQRERTTEGITTEEIMDIIKSFPPEIVDQLFASLPRNAVAKSLSTSSTANGSSSPVSYDHLSTGLQTNLSQTTLLPSALHPGGLDPASTAPFVLNSAGEASAPVTPSVTSLGKRRARSDSTTGEENAANNKNSRKVAKSKVTKVLSNMGPPPVPYLAAAAVHEGSSGTLSSFGNIPPPGGPESADPQSATASAVAPPAKRARKQRSKAQAPAKASATSGIRAMQSVFRASTTSLPDHNNNPSGQVLHTPQNGQQASYFSQGTVVADSGTHPVAQTQGNGAFAAQPPYPTSHVRQPVSTPASSSRVRPAKRLPLQMNKYALYRLHLAIQALTCTGNLRVLYPLLCYRPVQELMQYLLLMGMDNKWVMRCNHSNLPLHFEPPERGSQTLPSEANNDVGAAPRAVYPNPYYNDNANVRISRNVRRLDDHSAIGQSQMQMIPQNFGVGIPHADLVSNEYNTTFLLGGDTHQHNAESNFFGILNEDGASTAGLQLDGAAAQPGVGKHQASPDAHNAGYQNLPTPGDIHEETAPPLFSFADSEYDFTDLTWDDVGVGSRLQTMHQTLAVYPHGHIGPESTSVNVEGNEPTVIGQVSGVSDQHLGIPGVSQTHIPASGETSPVIFIGNDNSPGDSDLTQNSTSIDSDQNSQGLELFVPLYKDAQAINQALYGDHENDVAALFHTLFGNTNVEQTLFSGMGQQEVSSPAPGSSVGQPLDVEEYINFDP